MGYTLCVIGCGTMGVAILSGTIASLESNGPYFDRPKWETHTPGTTTPQHKADDSLPSRFLACVNRAESIKALQTSLRSLGPLGAAVEVTAKQNVQAAKQADVILLCCKPQLAHSILNENGMREALEDKLLISILAGVTISQLKTLVNPSTKVIRAMPNTPCKIREGMTVVSTIPASQDTHRDRAIILAIFESIGRCRVLEEKHFDACTALSGSGPAFACIFLEAMADGGVMMGLPRAEALELAAQSLQGAARMALQPGAHPAQIKDAVTTPGGCTIAGLLTLEDGRVRSTIARTIQVATERASQLGQVSEK
ncbi:pyrroline-5-carboxylate reductase [Hysterangium stoloniferum]|nr:pyrroline-5-carboxylate reductase [Hysterangium stoloniferum]